MEIFERLVLPLRGDAGSKTTPRTGTKKDQKDRDSSSKKGDRESSKSQSGHGDSAGEEKDDTTYIIEIKERVDKAVLGLKN